MANNLDLNAGAGGETVATDEIGGIHYPKNKIVFGPDNTATNVTSTVGMPVKVLSGALELGKVEDSAHSTGDVGVMMLAIRNDTLAALSGTDGDYSGLQINGDGALYVRSAGHVSTVNSSSTPLGIGGIFTGTAEDITHFSSIAVSVFTDEASASGGLSLQFSIDGTNWDNTEGHDVAASTHHFVGGMGEGKWFRVVYTNGATGQTVFRLQTILRTAPLSGEVEPIDHAIEGGEDAMLVRAVIAGQKPDNSYANVQTTAASNLKVSVEEGESIKAEDAAHGSGDLGTFILAVRKDTAAQLAGTDEDYSPLITDVNGRLHVLDQNSAAIKTAVELIDNAISGSEMQVDIVAALPTGTNAIGKLAANNGVDIGDVDVTSIAAGANLIGDVGVGVRTSGGTSFFYDNDLDETKIEVKATAGQIYWIHCMNLKASALYLQIFNKAAASVTVGTTVPDMQFVLPTQGDTNGAGFVLAIPNGIEMDTGITIACTTDSEGSTAPGANECHINMGYK